SAGDFDQELFAQGGDRGVCEADSGDSADIEVVGRGTYVGLALDVGVAGLEIKEACVTRREAQCRRAKYVETGTFMGGVQGEACWVLS
ncbi:hypothetical protein AO284_19405, partial [Pseudomonas sp. NZIPFR-PS2]